VRLLTVSVAQRNSRPQPILHSQLQLRRVGQVRTQLLKEVDFANTDPGDLRRLLTLDRYDRFARTAVRRASRKLGTEVGLPPR
jgi:hypothetical protein